MKKILLVGGSGTIGYFWANQLAQAGHQLLLTCTDLEKFVAKDEHDLLDRENVTLLMLNVINANDIDQFCAKHESLLSDVNALINNARNPNFLKVEDGNFSSATALVNEYLVDVVLPYRMSVHMAQSPSLGVIVNVGSIYGSQTFKEGLYEDGWKSAPIQYSLAKAALNKLTEELALRFAAFDVRVNGLALGGVSSEQPTDFVERYEAACARKGLVSLEDTSVALQFLLADENKAMTGQTLHLDNGFSVK